VSAAGGAVRRKPSRTRWIVAPARCLDFPVLDACPAAREGPWPWMGACDRFPSPTASSIARWTRPGWLQGPPGASVCGLDCPGAQGRGAALPELTPAPAPTGCMWSSMAQEPTTPVKCV